MLRLLLGLFLVVSPIKSMDEHKSVLRQLSQANKVAIEQKSVLKAQLELAKNEKAKKTIEGQIAKLEKLMQKSEIIGQKNQSINKEPAALSKTDLKQPICEPKREEFPTIMRYAIQNDQGNEDLQNIDKIRKNILEQMNKADLAVAEKKSKQEASKPCLTYQEKLAQAYKAQIELEAQFNEYLFQNYLQLKPATRFV